MADGIGRFIGLKTIEAAGAPHDCLELIYAGGDKILLPVENVELISRYGAESGEGALDKLGGGGWQSRKARAKKKIMDMADELIRLAAEREMKRAPKTDTADGVFREEVWGEGPLSRPIYFFDLDGDTVWGATAAMLRQLLARLTGTDPGSVLDMDPARDVPPGFRLPGEADDVV